MRRMAVFLVAMVFGAWAAAQGPGAYNAPGGLPSRPTFQQLFVNAGSTASNSFIRPLADATMYSMLGRAQAGPGMQCRWDSGTTNRFCDFGMYDNVGTFTANQRVVDGTNGCSSIGGHCLMSTAAAVLQLTNSGCTVTQKVGFAATCSRLGTGNFSIAYASSFGTFTACVAVAANTTGGVLFANAVSTSTSSVSWLTVTSAGAATDPTASETWNVLCSGV